MMQITKTNAMRILDAKKIGYEVFVYDNEDGLIHGTAVAEKIGKEPETVFKTLVSHSGANLYVFVIPVAEELDLKKAAKAAGEKKIEMLPVKDLQKWTESPVLVTSGFHMTRAMQHFKNAGLTPQAYPTDYIASADFSMQTAKFTPSPGAISTTGLALKEYLGILAARLFD